MAHQEAAAEALRKWRVRPASHAACATAHEWPRLLTRNFSALSGTAQPVAEIEELTGLKVRLFMPAGEVLRVLSSLLNAGRAR